MIREPCLRPPWPTVTMLSPRLSPVRICEVSPVVAPMRICTRATVSPRATNTKSSPSSLTAARRGISRASSNAPVRIRTGAFDDALLIPRRAAVNEDGEDFVFVARGDTVARVQIRIGATTGDTSQILTGLSRGDSIVTVGQGGLKQGSRIKPVRL